MIRYLFSIGVVLGCLAQPLEAKGTTPATSSTASAQPAKSKDEAKSRTAASSTARQDNHSTSTASTASSKSTPSKSVARGASPSSSICKSISGRLARLTAYWAGEGDYYTGKCLSSTGIHLHGGHCAVDPSIIPYGSVVTIEGLGSYVAVDTGSAVISREAAREAAHNDAERHALVIDLFFESRRDGEHFAASAPKYASISWKTPSFSGSRVKDSHKLADDDSRPSKSSSKDL